MSYDPKLGLAFSFDEQELEANRAGRLTDDQMILLRNAARVGRSQGRRNLVMLAVILPVVAVLAGVVIGRTPGSGNAPVVIVVVALTLFAAVILLATRAGRRRADRYAAAELRQAQGTLRIRTASTDWIAEVGPARFRIDAERLTALDEGSTYRVNYLATGKLASVLSIERAAGA